MTDRRYSNFSESLSNAVGSDDDEQPIKAVVTKVTRESSSSQINLANLQGLPTGTRNYKRAQTMRRNNMYDPRSGSQPHISKREQAEKEKAAARPNTLVNKYQLALAQYIKQNKEDVTLAGTKRFADKSGEYYLKNVLFKKKNESQRRLMKRLSLTMPTDLAACLQKVDGNTDALKKRADKMVAKLPVGSLTPIPVLKDEAKKTYGEKDSLVQAKRTAVTIRRIEYATAIKDRGPPKKKTTKKVIPKEKPKVKEQPSEEYLEKLRLLQEWWKAIYRIIKIQKCFRGAMARKRIMEYLENQEKQMNKILTLESAIKKRLFRPFFTDFKEEYGTKAEYIDIAMDLPKTQRSNRIPMYSYFPLLKNRDGDNSAEEEPTESNPRPDLMHFDIFSNYLNKIMESSRDPTKLSKLMDLVKQNDKRKVKNGFNTWRKETGYDPKKKIYSKKNIQKMVTNVKRVQLKEPFEKIKKFDHNILRSYSRPKLNESFYKKKEDVLGDGIDERVVFFDKKTEDVGVQTDFDELKKEEILFQEPETPKQPVEYPEELNQSLNSDSDFSQEAGTVLDRGKEEKMHPINYKAQTFFLDPKSKPGDMQFYENNNGINRPMTIKADFVELLKNQGDVLKNKRIQVTNATCDLDKLVPAEELDNLKNAEEATDDDTHNEKIINKVVSICDNDLGRGQIKEGVKLNIDAVGNPDKIARSPIKKPGVESSVREEIPLEEVESKPPEDKFSTAIPIKDNHISWNFGDGIKCEKEVPDEEGDIVLEQDDVLPLVNTPLTNNKEKSSGPLKLSNLGKSSYYHNQASSPSRGIEKMEPYSEKGKFIQRSPLPKSNLLESDGKYSVKTFNQNRRIADADPQEINRFDFKGKKFDFRNNYEDKENPNPNMVNGYKRRGSSSVFESPCYNINSATKGKTIQTKIVRFGQKSKYRGNEKLQKILEPKNIISELRKVATGLNRQVKINELVSLTMFHLQRNKSKFLSTLIRAWYFSREEKKAEVMAPILSTYNDNPNFVEGEDDSLNGISRTIKLSNN